MSSRFVSLRHRILAGSISSLIAVGSVAGVSTTQAAGLTWGTGGGGGTGTWIDDSTTANWYNGSTDVVWSSGSTAVFGGTAGAVTVSGAINGVAGMTFNSTGYSLTGGTLNLTGSAFTLGSGVSASIGSALAGTTGLNLTGNGTLALTSTANTLTGAYTIGLGSTLVMSTDQLSTTGNDVAVFGTLDLSGGSSNGTGRAINNLTGSGVITSASSATGGNLRVKAGDFSGTIQDGGVGKLTGVFFQASGGLLNLSGTNTYSGDTLIREGGILRLSSAGALPANSYLRFQTGSNVNSTLELAAGDLTRTVGGSTGDGGIALESGTVYFAARGADRTLNLGASQITWGVTAGFAPGTLGFGSVNATNKLIFSSPLSLNNAARTIDAVDGPAAVEGEITGNITGGGTAAVLTKTGAGTIQLSGTNTIAGFRVQNGTVILNGSNTGSVFNSIGVSSGNNGTMNLIGSASLTTGAVDFNVSDLSGSRGTVNMNSSGAMTLGTLYVGKNGASVGVLNQSSGTITSSGGGDWRVGGVSTATTANPDVNSYGIINLSGGSFSAGANQLQLGAGGSGVFTQSAGTATFNNWISSARYGSASHGLFNLSGGTFTQAPTSGTTLIVGEQGKAVVNVVGGSLVSNSSIGIRLSNQAGATGFMNVLSGSVTAKAIVDNGGTSYLYMNGGTIKPGAATGSFISGLDNAVVGPNGAIFDTNTFDITIPQVLAAASGSGVLTIPVISGGSGYVGEPIVTITGGNGVGASARAVVSGGVVTAITITSPGINYDSAPTVALAGGGATTAATLGAPTFGANAVTGGVTKTGAGVLTLTGANTYLGPTSIANGTLAIGAVADGGVASPLGASSNAAANLVFNGGALRYTGASASTDRGFTINAGKTATIDVATAATTLTLSGGSAATNGSLNKIGAGTLVLAGLNQHTGATTATAGVLAASGSQTSPFVVNGGRLAPAYQSVGALTVPALTFNTTGGVDFEFGAGNDVVNISNPGGLTLGTASLNLYQVGTADPFSTNGTYTLFDYTGAFTGNLTGAFSIANSQVGKVYSINNNTAATTIELVINDGTISSWAVDGGGSWNAAGNWTPSGVPNSVGAAVTLGSALNGGNSPATVALNGNKTVGTLTFDNFNTYNVTPGTGGALIIDNGIGAAQIATTAGAHGISAPITLVNPTNFNAAAGSTLALSGPITGAPFNANGAGTVVLSGSNNLSGVSTLTSGTLELASSGALGGATGLTVKPGSVLRVSGASTSIATPVAFDLAGGTASGVSGGAFGTGNFNLEVPTGSAATLSGLVTSPGGGSLVKRGSGSLTIANPGANVLANVGGLAFVIQDGAVTLDGGAGATYTVGSGELTVGDNTPNVATLNVASGTLNVGTYLSAGRGNGSAGLQSSINVTGGAVNATFLYTGYANGVDGYNANPVINISGNSVVTATSTSTTAPGIRLAESPGAFSTATLSGASTLYSNNYVEIGSAGRGVVKIGAGSTFSVSDLRVGTAANGAGAVYNRGAFIDRSGASTNHFALGNAAGAYGYYLHDSATGATLQEIGIGGAGGGSGAFEVRSGAVTTSNWVTMNRTNAANATSALLLLSGGTLNTPNVAGHFYLNQGVAAPGYSHIDVGAGGRISGGPLSDINLQNNGVAGGEASTGVLTVHDGGSVATGRIFASSPNGSAVVNLNGGALVATADGNLLDGNLDGVFVHNKGATIDTAGFNVTNGGNALQAPTGDGLSSIALADGGTGYIGRPIVQITGGGGTGATAVANFDEATGVLTGITVTSPGSGYTSAPTVTLVGGGSSIPATLGPVTTAANASAGGLTKTGAGVLALSGANTYAGPTVVDAGTLALAGSISGSTSIEVRSGATFDVSGVAGYTLGASQTLKGNGLVSGALSVAGTVAPGAAAPGALTFSSAVAFQSGSTLALDITGNLSFDKVIASDVTLASGVNFTLTLGYTPAPGTSWLVFDNTGSNPIAANLVWSGPEGQLSEGEHFIVGGREMVISYTGGNGNDIVLSVVPEPGSAAMLLAGSGALLGMRRRRSRR